MTPPAKPTFYVGTQILDQQTITVIGASNPGAIMIPGFDFDDLTDLPARVRHYPRTGLALPVRSEVGPINLRVSVGRPGHHPEVSSPEYAWSSRSALDLGGGPVLIVSPAIPTEGFTYVDIPTGDVNVAVAWVYGPKPKAAYDFDNFTETLFFSFW